MSRSTKLAAIAAASIAAVAATATPASAWTAGPFTATLSGNMTIIAGVTATCTSSTLGGTITTGGALSFTSAVFGGCGVGVNATNLPWSGSLTGGVATITGFRVSAIGCTYGGDLTGTYTGSAFPTTVSFTNVNVNKISGFFCPASATVTANYVFS